ncbi:DUF6268 family outer membrane beta-barrel protein [Gimesia aquarii]|uniref:DUF6268 domain-containing protein n=1 Tax=Gimesia aquarii TaxID=2527964 RepID=A0A517VZL5_9PLAN|nr:DUF6268 family outer membrane beta-barrel protein [Gimesia aquarii]QDT98442.1 hypothetical protein V144x_39440 [Gimesia aquarii]
MIKTFQLHPGYVRGVLLFYLGIVAGCSGLPRSAPEVTTTEEAPSVKMKSQMGMGMGGNPGSPFGIGVSGGYSTGSDLSVGQIRVNGRGIVPINPPKRMMMLQPSFSTTTFDVDALFDTPSEVYNIGVNMMWMERINERTMLSFGANPSITGDADSLGDNVRVFAMGMLNWQWIPNKLKLTAGAAYTGRDDIPVLPMAGLQWNPNEDWNISVILPKPKIAYRIHNIGESSTWIYFSGGLGGGTWDVLRINGTTDEFSYTEFQAVMGIEHSTELAGRLFAELGTGFSRKLEYRETAEEQSFGNSLLLRGGWNY